MFTGKTIFISALDWGLGHATRCVPLIRELQQHNRIILGVTPLTSVIFDNEFPELQKIQIPAYNISYSKILPLWCKLLLDAPRILRIIRREKSALEKIIENENVDVVISDNRFGLFSKNTKNIFITHQVFLKTPFAKTIAQTINQNFLLKFDELWIPDYETASESLSGDLSHGKHYHSAVNYIGPLSRLQKTDSKKNYDYLLLLSGPEPQHTQLRKKLLEMISKFPAKKFAMVTNSFEENSLKNLEVFSTPSPQALSKLIAASEAVICRSGYSSLMDMHALEIKNLILIPTKGQFEQEYLARLWNKKFNCRILAENSLESARWCLSF